jgi:hypothetical protein
MAMASEFNGPGSKIQLALPCNECQKGPRKGPLIPYPSSRHVAAQDAAPIAGLLIATKVIIAYMPEIEAAPMPGGDVEYRSSGGRLTGRDKFNGLPKLSCHRARNSSSPYRKDISWKCH